MCTSNNDASSIKNGGTGVEDGSNNDATLSTPVAESANDTVKPPSLEIEHDELKVLEKDKASGIVVFGAFVAGSLIGIVVCAPWVVIVILGAGAAGLCLHHSKAGDAARKVGKVSSGALVAMMKKGRELNQRYKLGDKATSFARGASVRIQQADEKRGFTKSVRARAASLWSHIDQKTKPAQVTAGEQTLL